MVQEIRKDIYKIPVTLPDSPLKVLNSYVIKGGDRNLIIDTGFRRPECLRDMQNGIDELGLDMAKTDILLTHMHSDHSGLAPEIASPASRIYIARGEMHWMIKDDRIKIRQKDHKGFRQLGFSEDEMQYHLKAVTWDLTSSDNFSDYHAIDDGNEFTCGDYTLKAIETPGHTPAHMCFWMEREKIMFTGDHVLFDISPNICNWRELPDTLGAYMDSLRMIDEYDVKLALPGHRETGDFHERAARLITHHEKRLEECLGIIRENPGLTAYEITGRMKWKIRCNSWDDFPLGQKWFAVGEAFAHIWHLKVAGQVSFDMSETAVRVYPV